MSNCGVVGGVDDSLLFFFLLLVVLFCQCPYFNNRVY